MHETGHIGVGLLLYAPLALLILLFDFTGLAFVGGIAVVGLAMLPDYDQRIPGIKHRGITHTIWFALLIGFLAGTGGVLYGLSYGLIQAIILGAFALVLGTLIILSHIAADALTPMGVTPLAPLQTRKYTYNVAKASNPIVNYALLALGGLASGAAIFVGTTL